MTETREERIDRVAKATRDKHAASPLTSTLDFWKRIVTTVLDEGDKNPEQSKAEHDFHLNGQDRY